MQETERRRELVALFEGHGALAEPALLAELAAAPDGPVRVQAVLQGLAEVPFHFDRGLWSQLEQRSREALVVVSVPAPVPTVTAESAQARKEAMRRAAAAVYDSSRKARMAGEDGPAEGEPDALDEHQEGDGEAPDEEERAVDAQAEAKAFKVLPRGEWRPLAAEHASRLEVVADMTGNSTCEGTTQDFVDYFQDRYRQIAKMLRQRRELRNAFPVERVKPGQQEVQLIGMVVEVATTKNGHKRIQVEDETGAITCLVRADERQLMAMADTLVQDEVIGVVGQASSKGDLLFLESIVRPDVPLPDGQAKAHSDVPLYAAFLSDIHVGSKTFLNENWKRMLRWMNGEGGSKREREAAGRVKYLVIPGDLVDGVGIYPGQQDELTIPDIYDQYGAFGDWMASIPDHIDVVIQPGNHDASRPAEPQPAFTQEVRSRFEHHDARFLANPATFRMHGVTTLGYHGSSLIDFATSVANLEYEKPLETMEQMLKCRHLAPLYGERTPVAPEHHDYLVISEVPDLFVTGHVHVPGIRGYRGVQMVNSGTWQSQTTYQKMLNFTPDPARMPLIDLQTLRGTLVDFQTPESAGSTG
ncbi:MAG TPA: DNA-directed DNA polymerase II small subunit [Candidatus Thermoplasmatota archaeon]|nr:DNA-directed DNA polymerase II small subunit [Candidatus Thermoplasmatota archaeon]